MLSGNSSTYMEIVNKALYFVMKTCVISRYPNSDRLPILEYLNKNQKEKLETEIRLQYKYKAYPENLNLYVRYEDGFYFRSSVEDIFKRFPKELLVFNTKDLFKKDFIQKDSDFFYKDKDVYEMHNYLMESSPCYKKLCNICPNFIDIAPYGRSLIYQDIPIEYISNGLKLFLMIKQKLLKKQFLYELITIFEFPEAYLYPELQVQLAEILVLLRKECNIPIFITSYSHYFINAIEVYSKKYDL